MFPQEDNCLIFGLESLFSLLQPYSMSCVGVLFIYSYIAAQLQIRLGETSIHVMNVPLIWHIT